MRGLGCASKGERLAQLNGWVLLMLSVEASLSVWRTYVRNKIVWTKRVEFDNICAYA